MTEIGSKPNNKKLLKNSVIGSVKLDISVGNLAVRQHTNSQLTASWQHADTYKKDKNEKKLSCPLGLFGYNTAFISNTLKG